MHIIPTTLPKHVILSRLKAAFPDIDARLDSVIGDNDQPQIIVILEGDFDHLAADAALSAPISQAETDAETQRLANIATLTAAYQDMVTRLSQIQNASAIPFTQAGFNQVVQAVKDEALYIERVMKVLKRLIT